METVKSYPMAEWDSAASILMHTPGVELFDAVIHPSAGLFEKYRDVGSSTREHQAYINKLRKNGIRVYTVAELLRASDIDELRSLADHTLQYDAAFIKDSPEDVEAYRRGVLQDMSAEDLINCILLQPTVVLFPTSNNTGYEATYIHKPMMNLYFTRDQSITTPKGHIICRMNSPQREIETEIIDFCYRQLDQAPILHISGDARLEGGDYIPAGDFAYLGCGMRTNQAAVDQLLEADALGFDMLVVCRDRKHWQMQMHLDTYFNLIDKNLVTLVESRLNAKEGDPEYVTVDIYRREPGTGEYHLAESGQGFVDFLRARGIEIIAISEEDELHYANNYLTIAPRHIVAVGGQSEKLQKDLADHFVSVEWLDLENLIGGYGAAHCMTQVLKRYSQLNL